MPSTFNGQLRPNEIMGSIYNMIISQQVFADNVADNFGNIVNEAKVDGTLYGDTKLYYATDALRTHEWGADAEAANLLALDRPQDPKCQPIVLDVFRQIRVTLSNYLSKRAWGDEGVFATFTSIMKDWVQVTKRVYDTTTYNTFIGTTTAERATQTVSITLTAGTEAQDIAKGLADLIVDMCDVSRKYNNYGFLRAESEDNIKIIWNADFVNKIKYLDTPEIYHKDVLEEKLTKYVLPARYFGTVLGVGGTADGTQRSLIEKDYNTVAPSHEDYDPAKHVFPGDIIPTGEAYDAKKAYTVDSDVICKVVTQLPPYMSAFEVGTSFFNPRSLTENNYLTFGRNTLQVLDGKPFVTVKKA